MCWWILWKILHKNVFLGHINNNFHLSPLGNHLQIDLTRVLKINDNQFFDLIQSNWKKSPLTRSNWRNFYKRLPGPTLESYKSIICFPFLFFNQFCLTLWNGFLLPKQNLIDQYTFPSTPFFLVTVSLILFFFQIDFSFFFHFSLPFLFSLIFSFHIPSKTIFSLRNSNPLGHTIQFSRNNCRPFFQKFFCSDNFYASFLRVNCLGFYHFSRCFQNQQFELATRFKKHGRE